MSPRTKAPPDPRVKLFVDHAHQTYLQKYGVKMVITAADPAQVKRILGTLNDLELLKRYWNFFLHYKDKDFILQSATKDLKTFCGLINRIVQLGFRAKPKRQPEAQGPPKTADPRAEQLWGKALKYIEPKLPPDDFATWFLPCRALGITGDFLKIGVPNAFYQEQLEGKYTGLISEALGGKPFVLQIVET